MTTNVIDEKMETQLQFEKAADKAKYVLPVYLLVPAAFWLAFHLSGTDMEWKAFGLGALGWTIALFLRGPLSALVMKMPREKASTIVVASSGVFEECVRIALLLLTFKTYSWALSVGQGWAAVEVLFTMVNVIMILTLAKRTDDKAMQAKEMLRMQGNLNGSPFWGVMERVFASALHIGFTLLAARFPWAVIGLIPLHSLVNLFATKFGKKSIALTELMIAFVGTLALVVGIIVSL